MELVLEGTVPLGVAVGIGYLVAIVLGFSFGKLPKLGPLIRVTWYLCFWTSVVVQSAAIVATLLSFWVQVPAVVALILLGAGVVVTVVSILLMSVTFWSDSHRKGKDGLELDGAAEATCQVAEMALFPYPYVLVLEGEGCLAGLAVLLVGFLLFGASFFPQRFLVRTIARIGEVGVLKA